MPCHGMRQLFAIIRMIWRRRRHYFGLLEEHAGQGPVGQSKFKESHAQLIQATLFVCATGYLRTSALSSRCYTTSFVVLVLLAPHPFCTSCGDGDGDCGWQSLNKKPVFSGQPEFTRPPFYPAPSTLPCIVLIPLPYGPGFISTS